jgi:hypothetical protein
MQALFGDGLHPDAEAAIRAAVAGGASPEDAVQASRLGRRFPRIQPKPDGWDDAVADAYKVFEAENGRSPEVGVERDMIRWNIAADRIAATLKRPGTDAEVATHLSQMGKAAPGMGAGDTTDYIRQHLKFAGRSDPLFSDDAIHAIHLASRGYPRAVNNLAVAALIATYAADKAIVDLAAAQSAITENSE